jgi:FtsP/CotA-like multicopper oxidase with cupredoxin domain
VDVLELGTAERVSAVVEMKNPGVWVLGTPKGDDRKNGMVIIVEYANRTGSPRWTKPPKKIWNYTLFGRNQTVHSPEETIPLVFGKIKGRAGGFNRWTINEVSLDEKAPLRTLQKGTRYRLVLDNRTDDAYPIHLHRNGFELTKVHGTPHGRHSERRGPRQGLPTNRGRRNASDERFDALSLPSATPYGLWVQAFVQRGVISSIVGHLASDNR